MFRIHITFISICAADIWFLDVFLLLNHSGMLTRGMFGVWKTVIVSVRRKIISLWKKWLIVNISLENYAPIYFSFYFSWLFMFFLKEMLEKRKEFWCIHPIYKFFEMTEKTSLHQQKQKEKSLQPTFVRYRTRLLWLTRSTLHTTHRHVSFLISFTIHYYCHPRKRILHKDLINIITVSSHHTIQICLHKRIVWHHFSFHGAGVAVFENHHNFSKSMDFPFDPKMSMKTDSKLTHTK